MATVNNKALLQKPIECKLTSARDISIEEYPHHPLEVEINYFNN
jgi:hypothetical protein